MERMSMNRVFVLVAAIGMMASTAQAQSGFGERPTLGVFGGVTLPTGDFKDEVGKGWHAGGLVKIRAYKALDIRVDGTYTKLGTKEFPGVNETGSRIATLKTDGKVTFGTLDAVVNMGADSAMYPGDNSVSPYLVGGLGAYHVDFAATCTPEPGFPTVCDGFSEPARTNMGFNVGAGGSLPLVGVRAFLEARYHHVFRSADIGGSRSMFLISAGLRFR
jgi:hypothetical protein